MNARLLADLLLEMNLLNPEELNREIRKLGGYVSDPRAREWFLRSVPFWMTNIDKLLATPYKATAEPRQYSSEVGGAHASKYHYQPSGQWSAKPPESKTEKTCPQCKGEGILKGEYCPSCLGTGSVVYKFKSGINTDPNAQVEPATLWLPADEVFNKGAKATKRTGRGIYVCPACKGKGMLPSGQACTTCHSSGRAIKDGADANIADKNLLYIEVYRDSRTPKGSHEGHFPESGPWPVNRLVGWLLDEADELPPDPEGVYTSNLHQPDIEKQIGQNFTPFKPSQALPRKKTMLGDPTPKEKLPSWATDDKDLYHFNPIQVRRRELFQRLESLVDFLNYKHALLGKVKTGEEYATALASAEAQGPEVAMNFKRQQEEALQANDYLRILKTAKVSDIDTFRQLMRDAEQFKRDVRDNPHMFSSSAELLATAGNYRMIKVTSAPTAIKMSERPLDPPINGEAQATWCTGMQSYAVRYAENEGGLYFIDRNNQSYVLAHFHSGQCKDVSDVEISSAIAKEIAPVCAKSPEFVTQLPAPQARGSGFPVLSYWVHNILDAQA